MPKGAMSAISTRAILAATLTCLVVTVAAPSALAEPPTREVKVTCDGGTTFTTQLVLPESGNGLPNVYRIEPESGTGAAADAVGFAWFQRVVLDENGNTLAVTGDAEAVDHQHELVECRHAAFRVPTRTFVLTGFFIPSG